MLDREHLDAPLLGALLVRRLHRLWPEVFEIDKTRALIGSEQTLLELRDGVDLRTVASHWQQGLDDFLARRKRYLLY